MIKVSYVSTPRIDAQDSEMDLKFGNGTRSRTVTLLPIAFHYNQPRGDALKRSTLTRLSPAIALLLLAGCSLSGRPSTQDLSEAIQKKNNVLGIGKIADTQADCLAAALHDSKLSDETLQAITEADAEYKNSKDDAKIMVGFGEEVAKCAEG
jgi:hypothetical protein